MVCIRWMSENTRFSLPSPFVLICHRGHWPRGVVASALTSHVRDAGFDSRLGQLPWASFFTLLAYVDPALIGYLDVRRLVSHILGTWRRCGVVDNVSYVQGPAQPLAIIHHPHVSTASLSKGWGVQRDVQAYLLSSQYLVFLGFAWAERDMGALYI